MGDTKFTKLTDENYDAWEFETRAVLKKKGVWTIASGEEPRPVGSPNHNAVKGWLKRRDVTAREIIERLDSEQFTHVWGFEDDPAEMWKCLENFHMALGLRSLVALWRTFTCITKADNKPIQAHIADICTLADRLTRLGDKPSEALIIATIFGLLLATYHLLIIALDAHPLSRNLDFVIGRILNEDLTLQHFNSDKGLVSSPRTESTALRVDACKITCHNCGIVRHFTSDCRKQPNAYAKPTKPYDATNVIVQQPIMPTASVAIVETAYAL